MAARAGVVYPVGHGVVAVVGALLTCPGWAVPPVSVDVPGERFSDANVEFSSFESSERDVLVSVPDLCLRNRRPAVFPAQSVPSNA